MKKYRENGFITKIELSLLSECLQEESKLVMVPHFHAVSVFIIY